MLVIMMMLTVWLINLTLLMRTLQFENDVVLVVQL
jgi:hypothetical protein